MSIAQLDLLVSLRGRMYELLMLDNALLSVTTHPGDRNLRLLLMIFFNIIVKLKIIIIMF